MREKIVYALGFVLAAQLLWTGSILAESNLKLRVTMFARATIAESMKIRKTYSIAEDQTLIMKVNELENRLGEIESKVAVFLELQHGRKRDVISQFRAQLIDKCCRLAQGKVGAGAALLNMQDQGGGGRGSGNGRGGGGGGGGHRRGGGGGFGNAGFPKRGGQ